MNAKTSQAIRDNGGEWDASWSSLEAHMVQLFTRTSPKTLQQLWQRCYFEDLWGCMGPVAAGARYLELGAGRGTTSMYLASKGCDVTMLDLSTSAFDVAKKNFSREGLPLPALVIADARETNLPAESFDCIFSIGLLEHFRNPLPVLAEVVRLLRPGGLHFSVIIPTRPISIYYLAHLLFCPWVLAHELMPQPVKSVIRKLRRRRSAPEEHDVLRTDYDRRDYLQMIEHLNIENARCIPYNAYHPVYQRPVLEEWIAIPIYQAHRKIKTLVRGYALMSTAPGIGSCDLLTFRKRA